MGIYQRLKARNSVTDLVILLAISLFFVAGVIFESRRSDGPSQQIAPGVGAESLPASSGQPDSESPLENGAVAAPTPTAAPSSVEPMPASGAILNPEAVGKRVFLDLSGIENESVVEASEVTVVGATTPDALVSINGQVVEVELNGSFSVDLVLEPGPNFIEIVSSNLRGQETSRLISVVSVQ